MLREKRLRRTTHDQLLLRHRPFYQAHSTYWAFLLSKVVPQKPLFVIWLRRPHVLSPSHSRSLRDSLSVHPRKHSEQVAEVSSLRLFPISKVERLVHVSGNQDKLTTRTSFQVWPSAPSCVARLPSLAAWLSRLCLG